MPQPAAPFSCQFSPNFPEFLLQLNATLVITTYQAGKVIFISPKNENELIQLPRTFPKAMGVAVADKKMAVATKDEVIVLVNDPRLAPFYPKKPNTYDNFFLPRATYYTGQVDMHDLHFGKSGLWGVNTSFSCLVKIDDNFSFVPEWQPSFISALASEDRCHLNGLAMKDGEPAYLTALGSGDTAQSWRENIIKGGVLLDKASNEIIASELPMPHSPRWYQNNLYLLLSASGELVKMDLASGKYEVMYRFNAFVRGITFVGDYAFVGHSKLRQNSSTFRHLDIAKLSNQAGITVIHLPTGAKVSELKYLASVDEIYDVQILPNCLRPGILNPYTPDHKLSISVPNATFWAKPQ